MSTRYDPELSAILISEVRDSDVLDHGLRRDLAMQLEAAVAEIGRMQREIKHMTYFEIPNDAISMLTDRLENDASGTSLEAIACDAATNIRQLQKMNARAETERNHMRMVVDAATAWRAADIACARDAKSGDVQRAEYELAQAVDAYRAGKP